MSSMVGQKVWNKKHTDNGIITKESYAYCPVYKVTHPCYIVKWNSGKITKPRRSMILKTVEGEFEVQK